MKEHQSCSEKLFYFEHKERVVFRWKTSNTDVNTIDTKIPSKSNCSACKTPLIKDSMHIKAGANDCYLLHGLVCEKCKTLYAPEKLIDEFSKICKNNFPKNIKNYQTLEERKMQAFFESTSEYKKDRNTLCVIETNNGTKYIIVNDLPDNPMKNQLKYTDELARELLAAALREEKNKEFSISGKKGTIRYCQTFNNFESRQIGNNKLRIQKNGGLYDKFRGGECFVDLLFYSPVTRKYEIVRATYNKFDDYCFIDICMWRKFVNNYGNPGFRPNFNSGKYYMNLGALRESSILKDYGYDLTSSQSERQNLLAEMVDLEIVTSKDIIVYLNFFISFQGAKENMFDARRAWEEDCNFIENYKVNPKRFLIAKTSLS